MGLATPKNLLRYPEDFLRYPEELNSAEESYRRHGQCSPQELRAVSQGLLESCCCVAPPIPFVGAVVMELAAMTHVPDNINPATVKPMEVSFIWYFLYRFYQTGQRALSELGSSTKCRCYKYGRSPGTPRAPFAWSYVQNGSHLDPTGVGKFGGGGDCS